MARIFISYKREDKDVVFKIKNDIEKHVGEKCWIDLDGIESDAQFVNVIINAIDEAEIFLFMYSKKHAEITDFENDWTIREINYAQTEGKRIIFLNIDRTPLSKWFKMMFGLKQQVDVHSNVAMNKLYADLTKWLEKRSEGSEISLKSDLDCRVYKDGLEWCSLRKGETKVVLLLKGTYKLNFVSNENSADYYEVDYEVEENDIKKYLNISLLPIKEKREKEEKRKSGNKWKEKLGAIGTIFKNGILDENIDTNVLGMLGAIGTIFKNGILVNKRLFLKLAIIVLSIVAMTLGLIYINLSYNEINSGYVNGHAYVDLGLSVKWATCNLGATTPAEYGDYFAWGETITKTDYSWDTYKYCKGTDTTITKYCTISRYGNNGFIDNKIVLDLEDDAAYVNWGGSWRMPTDDELTELREQCKWRWTTHNGVQGYKVVGPNGNSIFLPAAGRMDEGTLYYAGSYGYYWSSSLSTGSPRYAYYVSFNSGGVDYWWRYVGRSVRPVCQ